MGEGGCFLEPTTIVTHPCRSRFHLRFAFCHAKTRKFLHVSDGITPTNSAARMRREPRSFSQPSIFLLQFSDFNLEIMVLFCQNFQVIFIFFDLYLQHCHLLLNLYELFLLLIVFLLPLFGLVLTLHRYCFYTLHFFSGIFNFELKFMHLLFEGSQLGYFSFSLILHGFDLFSELILYIFIFFCLLFVDIDLLRHGLELEFYFCHFHFLLFDISG